MNDTKDVHCLPLVLVQPLDLYVEHRLRVDLEAERGLDIVREALLVALLDGDPLLLEARVIDILEQTLELAQVLEELALRDAQRLVDEIAQPWVALVEPAPGRDAVRDVEEPVGGLLEENT